MECFVGLIFLYGIAINNQVVLNDMKQLLFPNSSSCQRKVLLMHVYIFNSIISISGLVFTSATGLFGCD